MLTRKVSGPGNTLGAAAPQHKTLPSRVVVMGWGGVNGIRGSHGTPHVNRRPPNTCVCMSVSRLPLEWAC